MLFLYHTAVHKVKGSQCYPAWQQHDSGCNEQILPKNTDVMLHPTAKRCPQHPFPRVPFTKGHWEDAWYWQSSPAHGHLGLAVASRSKALWQDCHEDHECYIPKQLAQKQRSRKTFQNSAVTFSLLLFSPVEQTPKKKKIRTTKILCFANQFVEKNCNHWGPNSRALRHGVFALFSMQGEAAAVVQFKPHIKIY